jgi:long-chain acyl-CoA synthetase
LFSYAQAICAGFTVNCPESAATVLPDLREIGPTYFFAPPRIWENILTSVMVRIEDAAKIKRRLFHYFMKVAERVGMRLLDGEEVSFGDRLLYRLGEILVYGPLKDNLGFSRIRVAYTAGEAIGPEIFSFYRSLGINIKQLYGMTEATALVCGQSDGHVDAESVEVEIRISDGGEVQFRSPGTFMGYFKNPEATAETKSDDGWISSGDAGFFDDGGQLHIIDRAKDVGKLTDGTIFAPKYIENKLKFSPYVLEAVVHGDGRDFVSVFINIDLDAVGNWAEKRGLAYTSYTDLAARSEVYDLIAGEIGQVNAGLAADPKLAGSQIRRFLILHKELDPDDNELTRTRKVRRRFVADKYKQLIDALYDGTHHVAIEAKVTFEDGREGVIKATLVIRDLDAVAALAEAS